MEMTDGKGPDSCIDAVGAEAHGMEGFDKNLKKSQPDSLAQKFKCCKKAGTVSIPGVYIGKMDGLPFGIAMNKALNLKMGQTHMQHYLEPLLKKVEEGKIDPSFIITHRMKLDEGPEAYKKFRNKTDGCIKVVLTP
jgi:threonine dehydrogenase-like Zn-dependent dehydrogenase